MGVVHAFHEPLIERTWQLRADLTAYVALAESLGATLLTCDARLAGAPLADVTVELIGSAP